MKNIKDTYDCERCGEEWEFCPRDYINESDYPVICPFCAMPKSQLFHVFYRRKGFWQAIKEVLIRII